MPNANSVVPDVSKIPVPATAGTGKPSTNIEQVSSDKSISSSGLDASGISKGPFSNLGANVENHNGFDILKFNMAPGSSLITNQETMSYMDGGLSTSVTTGEGGFSSAFFRGITGASMLQNFVANPTKNTLKMVLSPLIQGSIAQININAGETWNFADKSFLACTPNLVVSGNINIFSNFTMMLVGENITYTTVSASKGSGGSVWVSSYGAVEKHDISMGTDSNVPLFINNGCFLGMLAQDSSHDYWNSYRTVGTPNDLFNAMFTRIGLVIKIQDSVPSRGPAKCTVLTQSLNPNNLEKYIANIAQKVVEQNRGGHAPMYLRSDTVVPGTAVGTAAATGTTAVAGTAAAVGTVAAGTAAVAGTTETAVAPSVATPAVETTPAAEQAPAVSSLFGFASSNSVTTPPAANTGTAPVAEEQPIATPNTPEESGPPPLFGGSKTRKKNNTRKITKRKSNTRRR